MSDFYTKCEQGIYILLQEIGLDSPDYLNVLAVQARIAETVSSIRVHGRTESRIAEFSQILAELNRLCLDNLNISFNNLVGVGSWSGTVARKIYQNLPPRDYVSFVGRERELRMIREWLSPASGQSIITIHGIGGIGKSSLALEVASRCAIGGTIRDPEERFGAVIWTSAKQMVLTADGEQPALDPQRSLLRIYTTIARCLEREDIMRADPRDQHELVKLALEQQSTLLVIDNLETMEDEKVLGFLRRIPHSTKVIVTTRVAIWDWPARLPLGPLGKSDVHDMLRMWPDAASHLTADQAETLLDCLGGVPLALRLCFSLIRSSEDLEFVIAEMIEPLGDLDVVSFCLDFSWKRLERKSRASCDFLIALAFFDPVSGVTDDMLAFLLTGQESKKAILPFWRDIAKLSLATKTAAGRYCLPPLVQLYAARQRKESVVYKWRCQQLQYYLESMLKCYIVHVDFVCGDLATREHIEEIDNLGIMLDWCQKNANFASELVQFADGFSTLLYLVGHVNRAIEVAKIGRETAQKLGNEERQYDFCCKLALYYTWSDRLDRAEFFLEEAMASSLKVPNYRPDNVLEYTGSFLMRRGGHPHILQAFEPLYQSTCLRETFDAADKDRRVAVLGRFMMGVWFYRASEELKGTPTVGDNVTFRSDLLGKLNMSHELDAEQSGESLLARAREWLTQGLFLADEIAFQRGRAYILNYLGNVCIQQGQPAEAEQRLIKSLELSEELQDRRRIARVQQSLFYLCMRLGRVGEACEWAQKAIDGFEKLGMREAKEVQNELNRFRDQARSVS